MTAIREAFGALDDGSAIEAVTLSNSSGITARIMTLGATLQSLHVPDREGLSTDIVLGHDSAAEYLTANCFFGATIGRFANRIAGGSFRLDGRDYRIPPNDGPNALHSGAGGFHTRIWSIEHIETGPPARAIFRYHSPDGEQGFPGNLTVAASYTLDDDDRLTLEYTAVSDAPTIVSITHHSYFNLAGAASEHGALDARLTLYADSFTPIDRMMIPAGAIQAVEGTPFDFRTPIAIGARVRDGDDEQIRLARGYDHNMVLNGESGTLRPAARIEDPRSGRIVAISTTAPGMQFYSGNSLDGSVRGKQGKFYRQGDGGAFEPQHFPDSPNQPAFPGARLDPGETYRNVICFAFSSNCG